MKLKKFFNKLRVEYLEYLKFIVLAIVMLFGFWAIYSIIWVAIGLPWSTLTVFSMLGLAGMSEWLYFKWLRY